jgi:hypothetical protein
MDALVPCFSSSTTMGTESRPRRSSQHIAYRREAKEAVGLLPPGGVSHGRTSGCNLQIFTTLVVSSRAMEANQDSF